MNKKAVYVGIVVFLAFLFALPATRDELAWLWAESRDQAADYLQYYTDRPKGLHAAEARLCYKERTWIDTKKAMINEAIKQHSAAKSDPEARKERRARLEHFFWKQVTNENTVVSYKDYLMRYPNGEFAAQAQRQIDELTHQAAGMGGSDSTGH
jgi:hypothetical protein